MTAATTTVSYRDILRLAWPASVAASVTPLLGAVDVWALAQSARPLDIAAVGLGSVIFSLAYWTFGFIRMSVAGLTAQAAGAEDESEARAALVRGGVIGAGVGVILVLLQIPFSSSAPDRRRAPKPLSTGAFISIFAYGARPSRSPPTPHSAG